MSKEEKKETEEDKQRRIDYHKQQKEIYYKYENSIKNDVNKNGKDFLKKGVKGLFGWSFHFDNPLKKLIYFDESNLKWICCWNLIRKLTYDTPDEFYKDGTPIEDTVSIDLIASLKDYCVESLVKQNLLEPITVWIPKIDMNDEKKRFGGIIAWTVLDNYADIIIEKIKEAFEEQVMELEEEYEED